MAIRRVLIWPDQALKAKSVEVADGVLESDYGKQLVSDMFETMYAFRGVGLAAIQVGVPLRLFVMDAYSGQDGRTKHVFVNPALEETFGDPVEVKEGCLSLPGVVERRKRYREVIVSTGPADARVRFQLDDLEAQCAQHEIEHLDGMTLADGAGTTKRDIIRRKIAKTLRERAR